MVGWGLLGAQSDQGMGSDHEGEGVGSSSREDHGAGFQITGARWAHLQLARR